MTKWPAITNRFVTSALANYCIAANIFEVNIIIVFLVVHVFVGARSDFGQTGWYWSNTTNATTMDFPPTSANICRQMAIRYFDGNIGYRWEYSVQPCEGARSYYVCEVQCKVFVAIFVFNNVTFHLCRLFVISISCCTVSMSWRFISSIVLVECMEGVSFYVNG